MAKSSLNPVYLVGAGPGDPKLLTLRAVELLNRAEVVIYDYLAHPNILRHVPKSAKLIYVGKQAGNHAKTQDEINALLVKYGQENCNVVRLKGGDPYIFGRGGEEAEYLAQHGLSFEIVPGISSTMAAASYAGIPLTSRGYASQVLIATGHEDPNKPQSAHDWGAIAKIDTSVFVMGVRNLASICQNLIKHGKNSDTPAAMVRWGTTVKQFVLKGTLQTLPDLAIKANLKPPALLVVGEVVALSDTLNWYQKLPLFGKRILVTRSRSQASALVAKLTELGAEVIEEPTIEIKAIKNPLGMEKALSKLNTFQWLVLTSPNSARFFIEALQENNLDARCLANLKIAAIGPATAEAIACWGLKADLVPEKFVAESLLASLQKYDLNGQKILLPRAKVARDILPLELEKSGAKVYEIFLYETVHPDSLSEEGLRALKEGLDYVTFTSSSTVSGLSIVLADNLKDFQSRVKAVSIGPITSDTALKLGYNLVAEAKEYTIDGLVNTLLKLIEEEK